MEISPSYNHSIMYERTAQIEALIAKLPKELSFQIGLERLIEKEL